MRDPEGWSRRALLAAGVGAAVVPSARAASEGPVVLSGATVLTHDGVVLEGYGLRIEGGRIVALEKGMTGGIDLHGEWLTPAFTDAGCTLGLGEVSLEASTKDDAETMDPVTPDARVWDAYNPLSELVPVARRGGVALAFVHPEERGLISGQAAMFRTVGTSVHDALLLAPAALCVNLGSAAIPEGDGKIATRMGVALRLREIFGEAAPPDDGKKKTKAKSEPDKALDPWSTGAAAKGATGDEAKKKPGQRVVAEARKGKLPVLFRAERADDIEWALQFARAFELNAILLGAAEGHLVAQRIADAGVPVLVGPSTAQPSSFETPHARYDNAAQLAAAGVKIALRTGASHGVRELRVQAGIAVAHGLPYAEAVRSITCRAPEIFGLEGWGRIELGARATLVHCSGDPLQARTTIRGLWIDGQAVSMETRQTRLLESYRNLR